MARGVFLPPGSLALPPAAPRRGGRLHRRRGGSAAAFGSRAVPPRPAGRDEEVMGHRASRLESVAWRSEYLTSDRRAVMMPPWQDADVEASPGCRSWICPTE